MNNWVGNTAAQTLTLHIRALGLRVSPDHFIWPLKKICSGSKCHPQLKDSISVFPAK